MKIFTLRANENWHSDVYREEWAKHAQSYHTEDMNEANVLWLLPAWKWREVPLQHLVNKKVVATIHHIVPEKFNKTDFLQRDQFVDKYHVPCRKTYDFIAEHTQKPIKIIGYWLNKEVWSPIDRISSRENLNLPQDKFIVGSFQRDTEGHDLKVLKSIDLNKIEAVTEHSYK